MTAFAAPRVSLQLARRPTHAMMSQPSEHHNAVATIVGDTEVDHAITTLVLAFGTDPVAHWMYGDPHQYLMHIPRLFRALGTNSFEAGAAQQRRSWRRALASTGR
jgi:hypothetical protein